MVIAGADGDATAQVITDLHTTDDVIPAGHQVDGRPLKLAHLDILHRAGAAGEVQAIGATRIAAIDFGSRVCTDQPEQFGNLRERAERRVAKSKLNLIQPGAGIRLLDGSSQRAQAPIKAGTADIAFSVPNGVVIDIPG